MAKKSSSEKPLETLSNNKILQEKSVAKGSSLEEIQVVEDTEPKLQTSLNEDLQELLDKNPRRFFGGCGG